jgi:hypothetical protein
LRGPTRTFSQRGYPYVSHFIGCDLHDQARRAERGQLHIVQRHVITYDRMRVIMMAVQLFANTGAGHRGLPWYYAVIGAPLST